MKLIKEQFDKHPKLGKKAILDETGYSCSQVYEWFKNVRDRKKRASKDVDRKTVENAVGVIVDYPYFGGMKGQAYMLYHQLGFVSRHLYSELKKIAGTLIFQEMSKRRLTIPERGEYEHVRPETPGEIWVQDFTHIIVEGQKFYVALVMDASSRFYLGFNSAQRTDGDFVEVPILSALKNENGKPPELFLLSDNGTQYVSRRQDLFLQSYDIVRKLIPACCPQFNGTIECGIREFKSLFYSTWRDMKNTADKKEKLSDQVNECVSRTINRLNHNVPKPVLGGVTPDDVHKGNAEQVAESINEYREAEKSKKIENPVQNVWKTVKSSLNLTEMTDEKLMMSSMFFRRRPLRRMANLMKQKSVG